KREGWRDASAIRRIFKDRFESAGLPYFNPHSFRDALVRVGERQCQTPEQFKAWSQNLGHEQVLTTLMSYGAVARDRQGEIMLTIGSPTSRPRDVIDPKTRAAVEAFLKSTA